MGEVLGVRAVTADVAISGKDKTQSVPMEEMVDLGWRKKSLGMRQA